MYRILRSVVLTFALGLALVGCKRIIDEVLKGRGQDASGAARGEQKPDDDQLLTEKLSGYIRDCLNPFSKSVHAAGERYLSWCDAKKGPTGKERNIYGIYEVSQDVESCRAAITKSNTAPPSRPDVEKLAGSYLAVLTAVVPLVNDAHRYYERGDYKDDRMVKGRLLHPKLVTAFEAFDKADTELSQLVDRVQEDLDRRELTRLEREEGKRARWHAIYSTLLAKPLLRESAKEASKIDLVALSAASDNFEKAVDGFEAYAGQSKAEGMSTSNQLRAAKELVVVGKNLVRRLRDKKPYSAREKNWMGTSSGWMVEGSPDAVVDKYNKLIDAYNAARF